MSVSEAAARARLDALLDRILSDPIEKCTDRDLAFRLCSLRRWITRAGLNGPECEFTTKLGGQLVGWKLTQRGQQVAEEQLAVMEGRAA